MFKRTLPLMTLIALFAAVSLMAGCGGGDDTAADTDQAVPAAEATDAAAGTEVAVVHDCEGGCGMTAVPEAEMTEIDGKWYCTGCAVKIKAEAEAETAPEAGHE